MKTGRKQRHFVTSAGATIVGLSRRPSDGRWRVIGTQITFTEPDEGRAIKHFYDLTDAKVTGTIDGQQITKRRSDLIELREKIDAIFRTDALALWLKVAEEIRQRPKWVASQTGIEQIGYLSKLTAPEKLPTLKELEQTFKDHYKKSSKQKHWVLSCWRDFLTTTQIACIEDITPQVCVGFRDNVQMRKLTGHGQFNLFSAIRRLVSFNRDRAIAVKALNDALISLALLKPSKSTVSTDPKPIEPEDYMKLVDESEGDDKAMMLLLMNCSMYLAEVIRIEWSEIRNGCLITNREKTGECIRIATLWPETIEALAQVERKGDFVFVACHGKPLGIKGAEKRFRKLRKASQVEHVTSSMIRDGAYTAAVEANVNMELCKLLNGHQTGMPDHYVKRRPSMVAPACDAIRATYLLRKGIRATAA